VPVCGYEDGCVYLHESEMCLSQCKFLSGCVGMRVSVCVCVCVCENGSVYMRLYVCVCQCVWYVCMCKFQWVLVCLSVCVSFNG
jgi:hypothetical protein